MRILHVCKYFFPRITGVTSHVENLGRQQLAQGHEVAVASWSEADAVQDRHGLRVIQARAMDHEALARRMADFQPEIIHAHSIWETTSLAARVARSLARPYIVTTHGTWHFLGYTGAYDRLVDRLRLGVWRRRVVWPGLLRRAGAVIALNALEEADARQAGVAAKRLFRIPNAVDPQQFKPGDAAQAKQRWGWEEGRTALFVGAMQSQKGLFTALRAAVLAGASSGLRWAFCGEGPELDQARAMVEAEGLAGRVMFLGRIAREDMASLYQAADFAVLPSRQEPFATVFLEAMACGLACIGSNDGGTPEIIVDSQTGFLVPPGDSRALAEKAAWLAGHPGQAQAMGRAGRERVERKFAWPRVAERIQEAYRLAVGLAMVLLLLAACGPALAAEVAALDILTMIDPVSAQAVEPSAGNWRAANPVWDGTAVRLSAASGETAAFQFVVFPEAGERLEDIRIQVDLPGGAAWRAYRAWHVWGVPEVAVPVGQGGAAFNIPSRVPAEAEATREFTAHAAVVEIPVGRDQKAGPLFGQVRIDWNGGHVRLPLELVVHPLALPDAPSFTLEMNSYGDYLRLLPRNAATLLDMHRLMHRFRCTFTLVPYRHEGDMLMDFLAPSVDAQGRVDFTVFDAALGGLFDGSAFADKQPVSHFILPFQAQWPSPLSNAPEYVRRNVSVRQAFAQHIEAKGWRATRFQEFHNESPEHGAKVPWRLDEPVTAQDMAGHERFLGYLAQACLRAPGPCPLAYRIDISQWQPLRRELERLAGQVTDWSVSVAPQYFTAKTVPFFRGIGARWLVAYGELNGFLSQDKPTPWTVFPAYLARMHLSGVDGFAQWQSDCWKDKAIPGVAAEAAPLFFSNASGARDFVWPGPGLGIAGPMPSLRLFALREGLNLLDYMALATRRRPELAQDLRRRLAAVDTAQSLYRFKAELMALAEGREGS